MNVLYNLNIPLFLTFIRLIIAPVFLPGFLVCYLPMHDVVINSWLALCFIILSLTDFFDGYYARKYNQVTKLGKILDPIADKFLLYSTLIALVVVQKIFFYWAIIFIGREFFIMALRLIAAEQGNSISVSTMGKLKTTFQSLYLMVAIFNPHQHSYFFYGINCLEYIMLSSALWLSIASAYFYYQSWITIMKGKL